MLKMFRAALNRTYSPQGPAPVLPEYSAPQSRLPKTDEPKMFLPPASGPAGYLRRKAMSLFFYGVCILGAVLGGLVLLVLYSLLVMAQKGDACLDQLEMEMLKNHQAASRLKSAKSENLRVPATSDVYHGGIT
jgi:hypothetical protein